MVKEEVVNKICVSRGMKKMSISTNSTWIDKEQKEGIELQAGILKPFWIVNGQRDYNEPTGEKITQTLKLISVEDIGQKDIEEPSKIPQIIIEDKGDLSTGLIILPEVFTVPLLKKWAELTGMQRLLMVQRTPQNKIKQVKISQNETASYVEGNYMIKEANFVFLFDWHFIQQGINIGTVGVSVYGIIEATLDGKKYSRPAVGYETINQKMTVQLCIKSATTDAIKKGLSMFGFNSDVYSGEV